MPALCVLSLSGVPVSACKGAMKKVRSVTTQRTQGRDPLLAALVTRPMAGVPLTARFNPREMLYHG